MSKTGRRFIAALGFAFGVLFGLWYNGAYLTYTLRVGDQDAASMSEGEIVEGLTSGGAELTEQTYLSFFGLFGGWIEGGWPMWFTLITSVVFFTWLAFKATSRFAVDESHYPDEAADGNAY